MKKFSKILSLLIVLLLLPSLTGMTVVKSKKVIKKTTNNVKIVKQGFMNTNTDTFNIAYFSDGFAVILKTPKMPNFNTKETVMLRVDKGKSSFTKKLSIIGFSDTFSEKYYPLSFNEYDGISSKYKKMDFFMNLKNIKKSDKTLAGLLVYDSFVKLEGITFDDGIHKCKLNLKDK